MTASIATAAPRNKRRRSAPPTRLCDVDWSNLTYINSGAYGRVFRVAPGVVVKIGTISSNEAERQRQFASLNLAVPVYDYANKFEVPEGRLRDELCPYTRTHTPENRSCRCHGYYSAILMAEARPARTCRSDKGISRFVNRFHDFAYEVHDYWWDAHHGNVGFYKNHYVAFDFYSSHDD